ncbi:MAG: flagellar basal body rod protein FlgB [Nitrospirae bacterium]|jgi:flagellar basal-body rod protein FlgB|nr:flagellar basal body rod protein FlgB [Nitrospirota bacterium]
MDSFRSLEQLIRYTNIRHGILASNIANADTPNYKAKDINFKLALDNELLLTTTSDKHMNNAGNNSTNEVIIKEADNWEDKNNVEIDMEVAKMTENAMLFQAGISLLQSKIKMYKSALRR